LQQIVSLSFSGIGEMPGYLIKLAGALSLIALVFLMTKILYRNAKPTLLTDDIVIGEVTAFDFDAQVIAIEYLSDRLSAYAITAQGRNFIVGTVGNKLYCRPAATNA
jgi:hypothetical protein